MPYLFKSRARVADVMMLERFGDQVLAVIGREKSTAGVITVEQIPAAIEALQHAGASEPPPSAGNEEVEVGDFGGERTLPPPPKLSHRFAPLIELLKASRAANEDVTWGI